jgi:hypothetical protein
MIQGVIMNRFLLVAIFLLSMYPAGISAQGTNDTVTVTPPKPTFLDSLHFDLFNASYCCCTKYYYKSVTVSDTMIMLVFQYDDSPCLACRCPLPGSHTQFVLGPQKAGKYGIYKTESMYCPPGTICAYGPIIIERVGEIVVYAPTSAVQRKNTARGDAGSRISLARSSAAIILQFKLERAQVVSVDAYSPDGMFLYSLLHDIHISNGVQHVALDRRVITNNVIILKVKGETFSRTLLANVLR